MLGGDVNPYPILLLVNYWEFKPAQMGSSLDELLKRATRREFDLIMVWAIDRLGRSIQHLVGFMNDIQAMGADLYVHQHAIDTTTPSGRMIFSIFSALGEYERELIRERIMAGQKRARAQGLADRPRKRPARAASFRLRV